MAKNKSESDEGKDDKKKTCDVLNCNDVAERSKSAKKVGKGNIYTMGCILSTWVGNFVPR